MPIPSFYFSDLVYKKLRDFQEVRSAVVNLNHEGAAFISTKVHLGDTNPQALINTLSWVKSITCFFDTTIPIAVTSKMTINERKYPKALVQGSVQNYLKYSNITGYSKGEEEVLHTPLSSCDFSTMNNVAGMQGCVTEFALERNWIQFDTHLNLALALISELGEVASLLVWIKEDVALASDVPTSLRAKIVHELADVVIYLLRLAQLPDVNVKL